MDTDLFTTEKFSGYGECIYCAALASEVELTDEHVVAFSLGGNVEIEDASCRRCAAETAKTEREIARRVLWDLRIHTNTQTRHKKDRPTKLPFSAEVDGTLTTLTVPIRDHSFFAPMPVWGLPGLLRGVQPSTRFLIENKAHLYFSIPDSVGQTLGLTHGQLAQIKPPEVIVNHELYARGIAKIAYCQAILRYGIHGFRRLALPDLILGRYPCVPYFVGSDSDAFPPPKDQRDQLHKVGLSEIQYGRMRLILGSVRLYASSGTKDHGTPIYRVVVGAVRNSSHTALGKTFSEFRASRA
jgi:hypothetical protein